MDSFHTYLLYCISTYNSLLMGLSVLISHPIEWWTLCRTLTIVGVFDAKLSLSGFVCYVLSDYCEYHLSDKHNPPPTNTDQYNPVSLGFR